MTYSDYPDYNTASLAKYMEGEDAKQELTDLADEQIEEEWDDEDYDKNINVDKLMKIFQSDGFAKLFQEKSATVPNDTCSLEEIEAIIDVCALDMVNGFKELYKDLLKQERFEQLMEREQPPRYRDPTPG